MAYTKEHGRTSSPFEGQSAVIGAETDSKRGKSTLWFGVVFVALLAVAGGAYYLVNAMGDPLRTLPLFPSEKYFANPDSIAGGTFKADLRVDADLGWRMGTGRLMAFSIMNESNRVAVLIPAKIAGAAFDKNQAYRMELVVEEGGLIRAKSFKKL